MYEVWAFWKRELRERGRDKLGSEGMMPRSLFSESWEVWHKGRAMATQITSPSLSLEINSFPHLLLIAFKAMGFCFSWGWHLSLNYSLCLACCRAVCQKICSIKSVFFNIRMDIKHLVTWYEYNILLLSNLVSTLLCFIFFKLIESVEYSE